MCCPAGSPIRRRSTSGGREIVSAHGTDDGAQISGGNSGLRLCQWRHGLHRLHRLSQSGGTASNTTVSSGGTEIVLSGGTDIGATIVASGTVTVSSGGTFELTSGTTGLPTLLAGATLEVGSGAVFSGDGQQRCQVKVLSGGTDSGITVSSGGTEIVFAGGTASATVIDGSEIVLSGGVASGTIVSSGGTEIVSAGGTASETTVSSGGTLDVSVRRARRSDDDLQRRQRDRQRPRH